MIRYYSNQTLQWFKIVDATINNLLAVNFEIQQTNNPVQTFEERNTSTRV